MTLQSLDSSSASDLDPLARRFIDLVYACALRQMSGDAASASDVTQTVMLILVTKSRARALPEENKMAGWLINVTRFTAKQYKRSAARRAKYEAAGVAKSEAKTSPALDYDIRDALDAAVLSLGSVDREAVVRRFLQGQSLAEIASALSMAENTVGRRVARALEKLRKILARRGIAAPAAALTAVLVVECAVKAPAACAALPASGTVPFHVAHQVVAKMAIAKSVAILATILSLVAVISGAVAIAMKLEPAAPPAISITAPAVAPITPQPITIDIAREVEPPSDALLKSVLVAIEQNRQNLHAIHVVATDVSWSYDFKARKWLGPDPTIGNAWAESKSPRRLRVEVKSQQILTLSDDPNHQFSTAFSKSFVGTWDGQSYRQVFGPPQSPDHASIYTWSNHDDATAWIASSGLLGANFSMQLAWERETSADAAGTHVDFNAALLDPAVLATEKLSVRKVVLSDGRPAVELTAHRDDPKMSREETFWLDPEKGYALLAQRYIMSGKRSSIAATPVVLRMTRNISQLIEAGPGIFYPADATYYFELNNMPVAWEHFQATSAAANEPTPEGFFTVQIPRGTKVIEFKDGIGTKHIQN